MDKNSQNNIGSFIDFYKYLLEYQKSSTYKFKGDKLMKDYITKFITYALDVDKFSVKNMSDKDVKNLHKYLRKSKFNIKRKLLRGIAVEDGLSAIAFTKKDNAIYFDVYHVVQPFITDLDKITDITIYRAGDMTKHNNGKESPAYYRYYQNDDGKWVKELYYLNYESKLIPTGEITKFDTKDIPVIVLPNNENYSSTFENGKELLDALGKHLENPDKEWEYDKAMLINNNMLEPTRIGESLQKDIESGEKRVVDMKDPNGFLQNGLSYLSSGGVSSQIAQRNYKMYKEEVLFYFLSWLVVSDGKTNKHGAEVITSQLPTMNHIQFQRELLEDFYSDFLKTLIELGKEVKDSLLKDIVIDDLPEVEVNLSNFMNKIVEMNNKDGVNNASGVGNTGVK